MRRVQDPDKAIRRIHDKIYCKATGPINEEASQGGLSVHNNALLFQHKVSEVLSTTDGGIWALMSDRPTISGLSHLRPVRTE